MDLDGLGRNDLLRIFPVPVHGSSILVAGRGHSNDNGLSKNVALLCGAETRIPRPGGLVHSGLRGAEEADGPEILSALPALPLQRRPSLGIFWASTRCIFVNESVSCNIPSSKEMTDSPESLDLLLYGLLRRTVIILDYTPLQQLRLSNHGSATKPPSRFSNYASATTLQQPKLALASATTLQQPKLALASATTLQQPKLTRFSNQTSATKAHHLWQVHAQAHLTRHIKIPPPLASTCKVTSYVCFLNHRLRSNSLRILVSEALFPTVTRHSFRVMVDRRVNPSSISLGDQVGSRAGDMTLMFAERFPDLYILPTEGTGEASPSLFMLLQERSGMGKDLY